MKNNFFIINGKVLDLKKQSDLINGNVSDGVFSISKKNKLYSSDNFIDLRRKAKSKKIYSVPPGSYFVYDANLNLKKN